jgi:GDP/UDP-N,N'-diacetylbacillosamine 2-epimerase (hydrolysing)
MSRKICVVTGTRAEYGLLKGLMKATAADPALELQLIATGSHLSPEFGLTYSEIEADGFRIDRKVEMLLSSDTAIGTAKSMGLAMIGFADAFDALSPDLLIVLGDRFEIFAAVASALVANIPVGHIHGGELTEGAFDDALRHAITKMSYLHFVAAEEYGRRVIQMGERAEHVFKVGGLGVDAISSVTLMTRDALAVSMDFRFLEKNLLVTFHPATLDESDPEEQMEALLLALTELSNTGLIFTLPNADSGGRALKKMIQDFVSTHPNAKAYSSLGLVRYLSCMAQVDGVVGNSSSGLLEAPTFCKGTVNIGDRQRGRLVAGSVIQCEPTHEAIRAALARLYSPQFQVSLPQVRNPYGDGGAVECILDVIRTVSLSNLLKKSFFDLPPSAFQ